MAWEILGKISYKKFRLPLDENSRKRIRIDWYFDEKLCEIILFAHRTSDEIDQEAAIQYIQSSPMEAIDSLLLNTDGKDCYQSIVEASFITDCLKGTPARIRGNSIGNLFGTLRGVLSGKIRLLKKREIRAMRLSKKAIQELLWEHFMEIGDDVMDIWEEDRETSLFGMHAVGNLEELTLYAMHLNEGSDAVFEAIHAYCDENIGFTTDALSSKRGQSPNYVSITLPKV